jgi:hypothetical protein
MQLTYSPYILLPFLALLIAFYLIIRGLHHRSNPIAITFTVLMSALAWWSLAVVFEHASMDLAVKIIWIKMSYFGIVILPPAWLIFTVQYADRSKWLTRRTLTILAILPITQDFGFKPCIPTC